MKERIVLFPVCSLAAAHHVFDDTSVHTTTHEIRTELLWKLDSLTLTWLRIKWLFRLDISDYLRQFLIRAMACHWVGGWYIAFFFFLSLTLSICDWHSHHYVTVLIIAAAQSPHTCRHSSFVMLVWITFCSHECTAAELQDQRVTKEFAVSVSQHVQSNTVCIDWIKLTSYVFYLIFVFYFVAFLPIMQHIT